LRSSAEPSAPFVQEAQPSEVGAALEHGAARHRMARPGRRETWTRVLDVVGAALLLAITAPLSAVVALALLLAGNRPVIFWQQRVGRSGRLFWFPKFTSMQNGAYALHPRMLALSDHKDSVTFKMREDPRVTRIGRVIRILSIDELPQLWTVLRGDMSLVGPRPPLPCEVVRYTDLQRRRLDVKPGLTCLWQVQGRALLPFERQVRLDIAYIDNRSIGLDLRILLRTIPAVLSCRGAF
jgi:lipopolysaccharide/colanic/teichoic acid biosynthesis glycosyltransferase